MGGLRSMHSRNETYTEFWPENPREEMLGNLRH